MVAHLVYESGNDGSSCNMHVIKLYGLNQWEKTQFFFGC